MTLQELTEAENLNILTHGTDVDGVVCAALVLKKFPDAIIETGTPRSKMSGEYDFITDLPLQKGLKTQAWIDHHQKTVQKGEFQEKVYDPSSKSAASLVARYLGAEEDELVQIAERADSVSYLTDPPMKTEGNYDLAWDVNDSVKAISTNERFTKLVRTLASEGVNPVKEEFRDEISHTRKLRRMAEKEVHKIVEKMREQNSDAPVIVMPHGEMDNPTVSGHIVFSLYDKGAKVCAIFYEGGCWLNVRSDFNEIDVSEITAKFGGGGHRKSAGASIEPEKSSEIMRELEKAGLNPILIDLREDSSTHISNSR